MGMAASQGRFLSLTARKSNVEYEGQQVNQQRLLLANQTSALNVQMLALTVPTPPDAEQFYNDKYVFKDGDNDFEIISGLGRESTIVREETTDYNLYSQPCNNGMPVVLTLLEKKLELNNRQLNLLSDTSSRTQIRSILDNGQSMDLPAFMCSGTISTGYKRINNDKDIVDNPDIQKYINDYTEINLPLPKNSDFEKKYYAGVPSYFVKESSIGDKTFIQLTAENYTELMQEAERDNKAYIVQEKRDENNKSIKKAITQAECNQISGLDFYIVDDADVNANNVLNKTKYLSAIAKNKSQIAIDDTLQTLLENQGVYLFAKMNENDQVTYKRISTAAELDALDDNTIIMQVVDPQNLVDPLQDNIVISSNALVGLPLEDDDETQYNAPSYYVTTYQLTQAMWDEAKKAGDKELMDHYIECLDFTNEANAVNNRLYYYTKDSTVHYIQQSYTTDVTEDNPVQKEIPQEFYEHSFKTFTDQTFTNCLWTKDTSGRYVSLTGTNEKGVVKTYDLVYSREKDEDAYDQAMMDYEYRKAKYEKAISDINAKTAAIQQEDKTLELRLKALDTEQEALAKELDAVKKVISGNVQKTFNTFGGGS